MKKILFCLLVMAIVIFINGCGQSTSSNDEKVNEVIGLIEELPYYYDITIEYEEEINIIKEKYNELSLEEQKKVSNYQKFLDSESEFIFLLEMFDSQISDINEAVNDFISLESITIKNLKQLTKVMELLEDLKDYELARVENIDKFNEIKDKLLYDNELVEKINENINNLIFPITLEQASLIEFIKQEYDKLSSDAKPFVSYETYEKAQKELDNLKFISENNLEEVYASISDVVTSDTCDYIVTNINGMDIKWVSSNPKLLYIENGYLKVSKVYQTHKQQTVQLTANVTLKNNETYEITKEVTVNPVKFKELKSTPVATYFQTSAISSYYEYSERYKKEKTLFSDAAKEVLDIVYYAFATMDSMGTISLSAPELVAQLNELKANDVRIVMCIAGVSSGGSKTFATLTSNDNLLARFVTNIMDAVERYNFDGVDIDWESTSDSYVIAERMNKLMKALREEMDNRQDRGGSKYLLSAAVPASSWGAGSDRFDFATLNKYVDHINMMSYDLNTSTKATHLSPLYSSSYDKGYGFSCDYGVKLYTSRGLDKNKIIIGAAGYGKAYNVTATGGNSTYPALSLESALTKLNGIPGSYATGTIFGNGIEIVYATGKYKKYIEYNASGKMVGSYLYNQTDKIYITYDSEEVITEKYKYAMETNGMGIMCWAYTEDTTDSYINSIYNVMKSAS